MRVFQKAKEFVIEKLWERRSRKARELLKHRHGKLINDIYRAIDVLAVHQTPENFRFLTRFVYKTETFRLAVLQAILNYGEQGKRWVEKKREDPELRLWIEKVLEYKRNGFPYFAPLEEDRAK